MPVKREIIINANGFDLMKQTQLFQLIGSFILFTIKPTETIKLVANSANMISRPQIEQLLSQQSLTSISDIVCFITEQVAKTINFSPLQELSLRVSHLQTAKGLDEVMIEEVKALVEAVAEQRQSAVEQNIQDCLDEYHQQIQELCSEAKNTLNSKRALNQIDVNTLTNTCNFQSKNSEQSKLLAQKDSITFQEKENLLRDTTILKEKFQGDRKELSDLKNSILSIHKELSNKINISETEQIVTKFESQIYDRVHHEKMDIQKIHFQIQKELHEQLGSIRAERSFGKQLAEINSLINSWEKRQQKFQKKLAKYSQNSKSLNETVKKLSKEFDEFSEQFLLSEKNFEIYTKFNEQKTEDLKTILTDLNDRLCYFEKIDQIEDRVLQLQRDSQRGCWQSELKMKGQCLCWSQQLLNTNPDSIKFQPNKTQIQILEPGCYKAELYLFEQNNKAISFTVELQRMSSSFEKSMHSVVLKSQGNNCASGHFSIKEKANISFKGVEGLNNQEFAKMLVKIQKL